MSDYIDTNKDIEDTFEEHGFHELENKFYKNCSSCYKLIADKIKVVEKD